MELDSGIIATGVALQQSGPFTDATLAGSYGADLSGSDTAGRIDGVAQFTTDGNGHLTGMVSLNDGGAAESNLVLTGGYGVGSDGRTFGTLDSPAGELNVIYYVASSSQVLFIETDAIRVAQGQLVQQH